MKKAILLIVALIFLAGCSSANEEQYKRVKHYNEMFRTKLVELDINFSFGDPIPGKLEHDKYIDRIVVVDKNEKLHELIVKNYISKVSYYELTRQERIQKNKELREYGKVSLLEEEFNMPYLKSFFESNGLELDGNFYLEIDPKKYYK